MPDLFRTERAAEIRRLLAHHEALLNELLEGQRELGRQLGSNTECDGLAARAGSLESTIDSGFAKINLDMEQMSRLLQQVIDKS